MDGTIVRRYSLEASENHSLFIQRPLVQELSSKPRISCKIAAGHDLVVVKTVVENEIGILI